MNYTIKLKIGNKWFVVAKVEFVTIAILDAIVDAYACVDKVRVLFLGCVVKEWSRG